MNAMTQEVLAARGLRVKALEWDDVSDRCQDSIGCGQLYRVLARQDGTGWLSNGSFGSRVDYETPEAAKAAAQADYAARILAALEDTGEPALIRENAALRKDEEPK